MFALLCLLINVFSLSSAFLPPTFTHFPPFGPFALRASPAAAPHHPLMCAEKKLFRFFSLLFALPTSSCVDFRPALVFLLSCASPHHSPLPPFHSWSLRHTQNQTCPSPPFSVLSFPLRTHPKTKKTKLENFFSILCDTCSPRQACASAVWSRLTFFFTRPLRPFCPPTPGQNHQTRAPQTVAVSQF